MKEDDSAGKEQASKDSSQEVQSEDAVPLTKRPAAPPDWQHEEQAPPGAAESSLSLSSPG